LIQHPTLKEAYDSVGVYESAGEKFFSHCYFCSGVGRCKNPNKVKVKMLTPTTPFFTCAAHSFDPKKQQRLKDNCNEYSRRHTQPKFDSQRIAMLKWALKAIQ
jgi:hypothetical protein